MVILIKKIISLLLILIIALSCAPSFGATIKDPYEGFSLAKVDEASHTGHTMGEFLGATGANRWYKYANVDFGSIAPTFVEMNVGTDSGNASGKILLRVDGPEGPIIAELEIHDPLGWRVRTLTKAPVLKQITGMHDLYLCTRPGACDYYDVRFIQPPDSSRIYPEYKGEEYIYSDIANNEYGHDIMALVGLGFDFGVDTEGETFPVGNAGKFYPDSFATRGKFAYLLSQVLGADMSGGQQVFADVPESHEYFGAINAVYSLGYMQGDGKGNFNPDGIITMKDAATTICKLLSYTPFAESRGGYPTGYLAVAMEEGILDGLGADANLTNGRAARLFLNTIKADFYDITSFGADGSAGYDRNKNGILSKTKNIFRGEGVVNANSFTHVNKAGSKLGGDYVLIDGVEYNFGETQANALLGYDCEFFYENLADEKKLVYIFPLSGSEITTFESNEMDILTINTSYIEYQESSDADVKKFSIDDCHIIYNGVALDKVLAQTLTFPFKGSVRYVDNNTEKDVLFIEEYKNVKISSFIGSSVTVVDEISNTQVSYNDNDYTFCYSRDGSPTKASAGNFKTDDVGVLYVSVNSTGKKVARLLVTENAVSGTVSEYNSNGTIVVDGKTLTVDAAAFAALGLINPTPGLTANFYCNMYDEIVYYDLKGITSTLVGFLMDYGLSDPSGLSGVMQLKIMDTANQKVDLDLAKTCKIDGVTKKSAAAMNSALTSSVKNTPVRYRVNSENKVVMLDTTIQNTTRGDDLDDLMTPLTTYSDLNWVPGHYALRDKQGTDRFVLMGASDVKLFTKLTEEEDWGFFSMEAYHGNLFSGTPYTYEVNDKFINVVVSPTDPKTAGVSSVSTLVYSGKTDIVDEEGEKCYKITGYRSGSSVSYIVKKPAVKAQVDALKKGDYIFFTAYDGRIDSQFTVAMLRDGAQTRTVGSTTLNALVYYETGNINGSSGESSGQGARQFLLGVVNTKYGEHIEVKFNNPTTNAIDYSYFKVNNGTTLTSVYNASKDMLKGSVRGSELKIGDVVCVTTSDSGNYLHAVINDTLAQKIQ